MDTFQMLNNLEALSLSFNPLTTFIQSSLSDINAPSSFESNSSFEDEQKTNNDRNSSLKDKQKTNNAVTLQNNVVTLHMAGLDFIDMEALKSFSKLTFLNMSLSKFPAFPSLKRFPKLEQVYFENGQADNIDKDIFEGLDELRVLKASNYKLCCPLLHPTRVYTLRCEAPTSEVSSCTDLLGNDAYRFFLWLFATIAVTGTASLVYIAPFQ